MQSYRLVILIGITEIFIGSITLFTNFISIVLSTNNKTPNVLYFVIVAAITSTLIGIGLLRLKKLAYQLLLYFSSVVILSKILIFMNIVQLNGALETTIPNTMKDMISIIYHSAVIFYLTKDNIKSIFHE